MTLPARSYVLAGWGPRAGAAAIDAFLVVVPALFIAASVAAAIDPDGDGDLPGILWVSLGVVAGFVNYCLLMQRKGEHNGQTIGKQVLGLRVVRDDEQPVGLGLAVVREGLIKVLLGKVLTCGLGWVADSVWPIAERENRALHDLMAKTHVVSTRATPQPPPPPQQRRLHLAPPIARHVDAAQRIQAAIAVAVHRAQLPYREVSLEVDRLMELMLSSAQRAQLLYETLNETPVARIEQRLSEVSEEPELAGALREQLSVQQRMVGQLDRFDAEMERIVVELDTVRANLISVSASNDVANQERLASSVRHLRDEMSSVAEGMDQAYR